MESASTKKVVLGTVAFAIFWFLAVFPSIPFLPIGRTAGSLLGAMLMVVFRILTPDEAYSAIDLPILGLLFGTMVVSIYLERADMFKYLAKFLSYKSRGPKDLLCRVCIVSAISSALFTNDTSCVVLTEFVLKIARQNNLPPQPFLLALATSANIGSSATPIGNPQNLVIGVQSRISFGRFLKGLLPAMVVGVGANMGFLLVYYWRVLSIDKAGESEDANVDEIWEGDAASHRFSPARLSRIVSVNSLSDESFKTAYGDNEDRGSSNDQSSVVEIGDGIVRREEGVIDRRIANCYSPSISVEGKAVSGASEESNSVKRLWWKILVYLVTVGMLIALLMGLNMSWTAIAAALALMVLDFKDACPCLEKVSYALLVFFCGMFITVDGFNETSLPSSLWNFLEPYARIDRASGVTVLALVILLLSNVASNVPTVLLLGAKVAASAASISPEEVTKAWFILAWVSTVAGNLSLLGSAANLIVCEQAQRAKLVGYTLSFWSHIRFGLPSTLLVTAIGLLLIRS